MRYLQSSLPLCFTPGLEHLSGSSFSLKIVIRIVKVDNCQFLALIIAHRLIIAMVQCKQTYLNPRVLHAISACVSSKFLEHTGRYASKANDSSRPEVPLPSTNRNSCCFSSGCFSSGYCFSSGHTDKWRLCKISFHR